MRVFAVALFSLSSVFSCAQSARFVQSINAHWQFIRADVPQAATTTDLEQWQIINLPHTWNDRDVMDDNQRGYYRGPAWYRKSLVVRGTPAEKWFLHFEGANQETAVYVNGELAGTHTGGYSAFTIDITPYIFLNQRNTLAVRVTNAHNPLVPPLSADFTFFGGIYRDVFLVRTQAAHFSMDDHGSPGVFITTPEVSEQAATVNVKGSFVYDQPQPKKLLVQVLIKDEAGKTVALVKKFIRAKAGRNEFTLESTSITPITLWSPETPAMYSFTTQLIEDQQVRDEVTQPLGFRWFSFDAANGFFLNGKPMKLIGANRHQDVHGQGNALRDEQHRADLKLLKDMGANFVRLAHYPQDPAVLRAADELGLLVWEETPLVNEVTPDERHHQNAEVMLREMIRQHYNHPSVILWGYMNEIYWMHRFLPAENVTRHTEETVKLAKRLEALARAEDPTRYTAMAMHNYPLYEESGIDSLPQVAGWNLYHGWYYDELDDFGAFMDRQHARHPHRPHIISEYGAGADTRLHTITPEKFDFSGQFQKKFHERFLQQIMARPYIAGAAVWNLIDFSSERRIDATPHVNNKGLATSARQPKDTYYFYQAALRKEPMVKIAEADWSARSGPAGLNTFPIAVYSNQREVSLFHNGYPLGKREVSFYQATWQVPLAEGINVLEARSGTNTDRLEIQFKPIPARLRDGFDVLAINAGSHCDYIEPRSGQPWLRDQAYTPGGWGYVAGKPLYVANKIGSKEDILTTDDDPLYQTMRVGMDAYRFDVAPGRYEVELLFTDPFPQSRRFVDGAESPKHEGGLRIFDVLINDEVALPALDLLKTLGYNYPLREKFIAHVADEQGLRISFRRIQGETIVSAIKIISQGK